MNRTQLDILFIEDNPDDVDLTVLELHRHGFEINWQRVDTELLLREALAGAWRPDIILSDYSMPTFNGVAALEITRTLAPGIPFIFLSGTIGEELAIESIRKGATDYILKTTCADWAPQFSVPWPTLRNANMQRTWKKNVRGWQP